MSKKKRIYLDNAAATVIDRRVVKAMKPYWQCAYGNPSAIHKEGREAKDALEDARKKIAHTLGVKADNVIFLSGGTESNNLAIAGVLRLASEKKKLSQLHAVTSTIEHPSILDVFKRYEREGLRVSYLDVDRNGLVQKDDVRNVLSADTVLVSIMYVNSEIGTIQPIRHIANILRVYEKEKKTRILFHTDASQAPLFLNCRPHHLGVDLLTIDGQKIRGPKGVGLLCKKSDVKMQKILEGGSQENNLRPGTENVALIVGLAEALCIAASEYKACTEAVSQVRDYFIEKVEQHVSSVRIYGSIKQRVANNVNISIEGVDGEFLTVYLDQEGIAASTKSACLSGSGHTSHVIEALNTTGSPIRFTLGKETTRKDVDRVVRTICSFMQKFDKK